MDFYKDTKWAQKILSSQLRDGSWGKCHSLSEPSKESYTTEQALRRLSILGFTIQDKVIQNAVQYLEQALENHEILPDLREKGHDWDIFLDLVLATWIRHFSKESLPANVIAKKWTDIVTAAFKQGFYSSDCYSLEYLNQFGKRPKGERLMNLHTFYQIAIISDLIDSKTADQFVPFIMNDDQGIYYVYGHSLMIPPQLFRSKQSVRYLKAIDLLTNFPLSQKQTNFHFIESWVNNHSLDGNQYDFGNESKDGIYLPLSDSWRTPINRIEDSTNLVNKILMKIK